LNARIIAVANAFEHSSNASEPDVIRSLEAIFEGANTLYDSEIVTALVKAYENKI
jgi:HD-GYP domain-containing protein (c-di-GMP phosphodiesterase class II)